jgi:hypothetical protein
VKTWILSGRSCFGGKGRKGVRPYNIFLNSEGIPGKMQSFPARRTTGWLLTVRILTVKSQKKMASTTCLHRRKELERICGEECRSMVPGCLGTGSFMSIQTGSRCVKDTDISSRHWKPSFFMRDFPASPLHSILTYPHFPTSRFRSELL